MTENPAAWAEPRCGCAFSESARQQGPPDRPGTISVNPPVVVRALLQAVWSPNRRSASAAPRPSGSHRCGRLPAGASACRTRAGRRPSSLAGLGPQPEWLASTLRVRGSSCPAIVRRPAISSPELSTCRTAEGLKTTCGCSSAPKKSAERRCLSRCLFPVSTLAASILSSPATAPAGSIESSPAISLKCPRTVISPQKCLTPNSARLLSGSRVHSPAGSAVAAPADGAAGSTLGSDIGTSSLGRRRTHYAPDPLAAKGQPAALTSFESLNVLPSTWMVYRFWSDGTTLET